MESYTQPEPDSLQQATVLPPELNVSQQQTVALNQSSRCLMPIPAPYSQFVKILAYKKIQFISLTLDFHALQELMSVKSVQSVHKVLFLFLNTRYFLLLNRSLTNCITPLLNKNIKN
jgi:hypothetical protein